MWSCLSMVHWGSVKAKALFLSPVCPVKLHNFLMRSVPASPSAVGMHWEWIALCHPQHSSLLHWCWDTLHEALVQSLVHFYIVNFKTDFPSGLIYVCHFKLLSAQQPNAENSPAFNQEEPYYTNFYCNQDHLWDKLSVQQQSKLFLNKPFIIF